MPIGMLGAGAIDAGMGLILGSINDRRQLKQQGKLQNQQIQGQKEMTDYQYSKMLQMWKDTSYGAQTEEMRKAGINPALMYGMGGGGGQTAGGGTGSVTGGVAPSGGGEAQAMMGMGIQAALLRAQKENIEADTKEKLSRIPGHEGIPGVQGQQIAESKGRVELMAQQYDNERIKNTLLEIDRQIGRSMAHIQDETQGAQIAEKIAEAEQEMAKAKVAKETIDADIKKIRAAAAGQIIANALMQAQTGKVNADKAMLSVEAHKWEQELAQGWAEINLQKLDGIVRTIAERNKMSIEQAKILTNTLEAVLGLKVLEGIKGMQPPKK